MKKQYFLLGVIFLISLGVAVFLFSKQKPSPPPPVAVTYEIKEPPQEVFVPGAPTGVIFSYSGQPLVFPLSLPIYKTDYSLLKTDQIAKLAGSLGFTTAPTIKSSEGNVRTLWNEKDKSFSFVSTLSQQSVSYQKTLSLAGGQSLSGEQAIGAAKAFLSKFFPSSLSFSGSLQPNSSLEGLVIQEKPKPALFLVLFSLLLDNKFPFLAANYEPVVASSVVDEKGTTRSLSFVYPPVFIQTKTTNVLPLNVAIDGLNKGKGFLISSQTGNTWGSTTQFQSVTIKSATIVYIPTTGGTLAEPAFLFSGTGTGPNGKAVDVRYVLFASSQ